MSLQDDLTALLAHVVWIGGSPCAGKTSVAQQLADRYLCWPLSASV